MLTIRPTKMLARRLAIDLPMTPPSVTNRVADWCAHEFRVGRYPLEDRDETPVELSRWLAESTMSALGMNSPDRVFPRLGR